MILAIGGSILAVLLSIIGFFLRQLYGSIKEMNTSLTGLHVEVKLLKVQFSNNGKDLIKLEMKVEEHDKKIDDNSKQLIQLQAEHDNCPARLDK